MRDDPVLIIKDTKKHYIYFLPDEMKLCEKYKTAFLQRKVKRVCGCKVLKSPDEEDRLRLRCAEPVAGMVRSHTVAVYYYYPDLTPSCKKMRDHLMFRAK